MNASELYRAGKLQDAVEAQIKEVKANPADQGKRLFLFELLAFAGDLDRAKRQIEAVQYQEPELIASVTGYRRLLDSEQARRQLFADGVVPRFFGEQPEHVQFRLQTVQLLREKRPGEAAQFLAKAHDAAPAVKGELNGKKIDTLRDADDLFGTVLEVMAQGGYYWVPLEQVESVTTNPPRFPRDLLWMPARLELQDGSGGNVFLPVLYPGSHESSDDQIRLGRMTDWKTLENGPTLGVGTHLFLVGEEALSLPEWRQLEVEGRQGEQKPAPAGAP
jgi:type VI secretion system protein ImpE